MTKVQTPEPARRDAFSSYRSLPFGWAEELVRGALVVIAGVGTLGSALAEALASLGVGRIALLDDDLVEPHNRLRMSLVGELDQGREKVYAVRDGLARRFGGLVRVAPIFGSVQTSLGAGLVRRASCVFLCADNRAGRLHAARAARSVGTPHLSGAIEALDGCVSGMFAPPETGCYECTLSVAERTELLERRFRCAAAPDPGPRSHSIPTTSIAATLTAAFMADAFRQFMCGDREPVLGRRLHLQPGRRSLREARYRSRTDCPCRMGTPTPAPVALDAARDDFSPRDLLREAAPRCGADGWLVLDYSLVIAEVCAGCGHRSSLARPRHAALPGSCAECGAATVPVSWTSVLSTDHPLAELRFSELALPALHPVMVRGARGMETYEFAGDARRLGLEEATA